MSDAEKELTALLKQRMEHNAAIDTLNVRIKSLRDQIAAPRRKAMQEEKEAAHRRWNEADNARTNKRLDIFRMKLNGAKAKDVAEKYGISKAYAGDLLRYSKTTAYYAGQNGELSEGDPLLSWYEDVKEGRRSYCDF